MSRNPAAAFITWLTIAPNAFIASQWGNCRTGTRVVHVDRIERFVEAEGVWKQMQPRPPVLGAVFRLKTVRRALAPFAGMAGTPPERPRFRSWFSAAIFPFIRFDDWTGAISHFDAGLRDIMNDIRLDFLLIRPAFCSSLARVALAKPRSLAPACLSSLSAPHRSLRRKVSRDRVGGAGICSANCDPEILDNVQGVASGNPQQ